MKINVNFTDLFPCWVTGATITDFDGDGLLDLLVAHGESASQPISVFKVNQVCHYTSNKDYEPKYNSPIEMLG